MEGVNIKTGIVSIIKLEKGIMGLSDKVGNETFVMAVPTNQGDSGGPVFVIYEDKYYLIGMAYATYLRADGYGFAVKSNQIMDVVNTLKFIDF